jgi:hypothetical protein
MEMEVGSGRRCSCETGRRNRKNDGAPRRVVTVAEKSKKWYPELEDSRRWKRAGTGRLPVVGDGAWQYLVAGDGDGDGSRQWSTVGRFWGRWREGGKIWGEVVKQK